MASHQVKLSKMHSEGKEAILAGRSFKVTDVSLLCRESHFLKINRCPFCHFSRIKLSSVSEPSNASGRSYSQKKKTTTTLSTQKGIMGKHHEQKDWYFSLNTSMTDLIISLD